MSLNRSLCRNVHFYDATDHNTPLGGLIQNGTITEDNFLNILSVLLITEASIRVQEWTSGYVVSTIADILKPRTYDVYCDGTYLVYSCTLLSSFSLSLVNS